MAKIYHIKKVPIPIKKWFNLNFPQKEGYTYDFYWYESNNKKIYGCWVYKNGKFWHNATQANIIWFKKNMGKRIYK